MSPSIVLKNLGNQKNPIDISVVDSESMTALLLVATSACLKHYVWQRQYVYNIMVGKDSMFTTSTLWLAETACLQHYGWQRQYVGNIMVDNDNMSPLVFLVG